MSKIMGVVAGVMVSTAVVAGAAAPDVHQWAQALAKPALAGAGADAAGRVLTYGHLLLSFASGRLIPVVAEERVVGAYFVGRGSFHYTSADPYEAAVYRTNVARCSSYAIDKDGAITDTFTDALLMVPGGVDELAGGVAWREGEVPAGAAEAFARHLARFASDRGVRYPQLVAEAVLDPPAKPVAIAEMIADKDDVVWMLDGMRDFDEAIAVMRKLKNPPPFLKDRRYPDVLSEQPLDRSRLEPAPRRVMLMALDATITNPEGTTAKIETTETFQAMAPIRVLPLSLWSERLVTEGANSTYVLRDYTLSRVTLESGESLPFSHVNGDLLVELPRTLAEGESVTLKLAFGGDVLFHPGNDAYWDLPTSSWYPSVPLEDQYLTYHAIVKVKKPFTPFSCGRTVRRWEEGELACAEFREDKPIQIPVVLAGKYTTVSEEKNGVTVRVSSYVTSDERGAKKLINNAFALIDFYKAFLGDYPFAELNIIEINSYGFGQAPAGVIFLTKEAFTPLQDETSRAFSEGVNARVAHEMAHAWWGHVVKLTSQDQWLSESTAQYFAAFAMSKLRRASEFDRGLDEWRRRARFVKDSGSVYMADFLSGERAEDDWQGLLYGKGPLVLHALRKHVGDNTFFTILKSYLKSFNFKYAETRHFVGLTNFVTKKDYGDFFNRYLYGTEWPKE